MPNDAQFITGEVPDAMREGVELDRETVAQPTRIIQDLDGQAAQLTQHRFPRPDHIPAGPPKEMPVLVPSAWTPVPNQMSYDFPLLPGVQAHITLMGEVTADHIAQLVDYLSVACKNMKEQPKPKATKVPKEPHDRRPASDD